MALSRIRDRALTIMCESLLVIAILALVGMMVIIVADIAMRFLYNSPIRGSYDLVTIFLVIMISFGLPKVVADREEIVIDIVDNVFPRWLTYALMLTACVLTIGILAFILWAMTGSASSAFRFGDRSLQLNLPIWSVWTIAMLGIAATLIAAIVVLWRHFDPAVPPANPDASS